MKKQVLAIGLCVLAGASAPALAQLRAPAAVAGPPAGFYGGVALRDGAAGTGLQLGQLPLAWGTFGTPMTDDAPSRSLFFGGYRFGNDLALEASFATAERYALEPDRAAGRRGGVGLSLANPDTAGSRTWNADLYTTWSVLPRFSLYGRLGYAQTDVSGNPALASLPAGDPRRGRDGVSYGLGMRYDVNRAFGLRLEYARFGRFAGELQPSGVLPETDQVQLGVQLRF